MERNSCRLAAKDYAALAALLEDPQHEALEARTLIERKLADADIMIGSAIDARMAQIGSRLLFRINDSPAYERTLVLNATAAARAELPVTLPRGLALLGLIAGQSARVPGADASETVYLDAVLGDIQPPPRETGQVLSFARPVRRSQNPGTDDDPGPSAA